MSRLACIIAAALTVTEARAEEEHIVIGPDQVWIEDAGPVEVLWVGPNVFERTQALSGPDIETLGLVAEAGDVAMLGARAIVAVVPGTHSCDTLTDPLDYYVISLDPVLTTDGPLTACGDLTMSLTAGAILLEKDPMRTATEDGGQSVFWVPGRGFVARLE